MWFLRDPHNLSDKQLFMPEGMGPLLAFMDGKRTPVEIHDAFCQMVGAALDREITFDAIARLDDAGIPFISILTDPTTGGTTASYAMLGDINIAEPNALIGFAGPRTIKATIGIELPEGFQTSEFLLEHGFVDRIVTRDRLKAEIARAIDYCGK